MKIIPSTVNQKGKHKWILQLSSEKFKWRVYGWAGVRLLPATDGENKTGKDFWVISE